MDLSNEIQELLTQYDNAREIRQQETQAASDKFKARSEEINAAAVVACPVKLGDRVKVDTASWGISHSGKVIVVDRIYAFNHWQGSQIKLRGMIIKKNGDVGKVVGTASLHHCEFVK